jgi:hypothetical protein
VQRPRTSGPWRMEAGAADDGGAAPVDVGTAEDGGRGRGGRDSGGRRRGSQRMVAQRPRTEITTRVYRGFLGHLLGVLSLR